jgi:hypothetical protein
MKRPDQHLALGSIAFPFAPLRETIVLNISRKGAKAQRGKSKRCFLSDSRQLTANSSSKKA